MQGKGRRKTFAAICLTAALFQRVANYARCSFDLRWLVRRGNEPRLKLRGCKINSRFEAMVEELGEAFEVAPASTGEIIHWPGCKEEAEHRADAMKGRAGSGLA